MKKFLGLYCKEEEKGLKEKLMSYTKIQMKFVSFLEVYVNDDEFMHVTIIDDLTYDNKKDLVLIHGLAGSSLNYFKMFKRLSKQFRIYAVDLPGMGLSSRHNFEHSNLHDGEEYFVEKLKLCFDKLDVSRFYLCGHSFGGYISSLFTMRYPKYVEKLILLSPVGLSSNYKEIVSTRLEDFLQSICFRYQKMPTTLLKAFGNILPNYLFYYICDQSKFRGLTDKEEFNTNRDFLHILLRNQSGSEKAVFLFFNKSLQAYKPLTYYYESLKDMRILVLYGTDDWCPKNHAEDLKNLLPQTVEVDVVSDSGHLLYTDNYEETTDKILAFIHKTEDDYIKQENTVVSESELEVDNTNNLNMYLSINQVTQEKLENEI